MKYLIVLITASLMSIALSFNAEAQILNRLKKKAQQASEQKAEEKLAEQVEQAAEQMVEKSWNSIFGEMSTDSTSGGSIPFSMNSNVTTEDKYHFDTITSMEIETINKNGKSEPPMIMHMHFNKGAMYTGAKFESEEMQKDDGDLFIIYDFKNSAMLMLISKDKDKFSFAYDWKQVLTSGEKAEETESDEDVNRDETVEGQGFTKIGSKDILGYSSDGYRSQTDDQKVEIWVSRDAEFGMNNLFSAHANAKQMKGKIPENYPQGMIMETTSEDLNSGDKTTMKVTDIKKNARVSYTMADYPAMTAGMDKKEN